MKTQLIKTLKSSVLVAVLLALCSAKVAGAAEDAAFHGSHGFFRGPAELHELYWRWFYGSLTLPTDRNGNSVIGPIVMMPLPATPGDGSPGHLDVTLNADQAFVLPLFGLIGTSYSDGTPPDQFINTSVFKTMEITFKIDGQTAVNRQNVMDFYVQTLFEPAVPFNYPPLASLIWLQDLAGVHLPLSRGTHTMSLDLQTTEALPPIFGGGFAAFHNTWTVTVKAAR